MIEENGRTRRPAPTSKFLMVGGFSFCFTSTQLPPSRQRLTSTKRGLKTRVPTYFVGSTSFGRFWRRICVLKWDVWSCSNFQSGVYNSGPPLAWAFRFLSPFHQDNTQLLDFVLQSVKIVQGWILVLRMVEIVGMTFLSAPRYQSATFHRHVLGNRRYHPSHSRNIITPFQIRTGPYI